MSTHFSRIVQRPDFCQSWKIPWKSWASHLITTSFGCFSFTAFLSSPCDFSLLVAKHTFSSRHHLFSEYICIFFFLPKVALLWAYVFPSMDCFHSVTPCLGGKESCGLPNWNITRNPTETFFWTQKCAPTLLRTSGYRDWFVVCL